MAKPSQPTPLPRPAPAGNRRDSPGPSPDLTPREAAQALADLARLEDGLASRVGALTGMVWGLVSAAIFLTYGFAPQVEPGWLVPFLWLPWTAGGVAVSVCAWKLHAVSLRRPLDRRQALLWGLGFAALFAGAMALMHALGLADGDGGAFAYMLVVNGVAGLVVAAAVRHHHGGLAALPMALAGAAIVAGAFLLAAAGLDTVAMAFASAGLAGGAFLLGSLVSFAQG